MSWEFFDSNGNLQVLTNPGGIISAIKNSETTYTSGTVSLSDPGNVQVASTTGNAFKIDLKTQNYWGNIDRVAQTTFISFSQSTSTILPLKVPYPLTVSFLRFPVSGGATSSTMATSINTTFSASMLSTYNIHLYSQGTGVNSKTLQYAGSTQIGMSNQWSLQANSTGSQWTLSYRVSYANSAGNTNTSTTLALSNASFQLSSAFLSNFNGPRNLDFPWATSLSAGPWFLAIGLSSTTSTQGNGVSALTALKMNQSFYGVTQFNQGFDEFGSATNSSYMLFPGLGSFSFAAGATTSSIDMTRISTGASHVLPVVAFHMTN